jgi:deazaflavin-dependent oxidoreductase (nitroreductase family)
MRSAFRILNRFFMVPAFRLGLGPLLGSPFGGYIMVLKTRGRLTGRWRYTPLNYAIANAYVYWIAGFGKVSHWVANIAADANVELMLPTSAVAGQAQRVTDDAERQTAIRQVMINSGFAVYVFEGLNPHTLSNERLRELGKRYLVFRLRPEGIGSGPSDPAGWRWFWPTVVISLAILRLAFWLFLPR